MINERILALDFLTDKEKAELADGEGAILIDPMVTFPGDGSGRDFDEVLKLFDSCIKDTLMTEEGRILVYSVGELETVIAWDCSDSNEVPESSRSIDTRELTNAEEGEDWDAFGVGLDGISNIVRSSVGFGGRWPLFVDFDGDGPEEGEEGFMKNGIEHRIIF